MVRLRAGHCNEPNYRHGHDTASLFRMRFTMNRRLSLVPLILLFVLHYRLFPRRPTVSR